MWASLYLQPTTRAWVMQGQAAKQGLGTGSTCSSSSSSSIWVAQGHHSEAKVSARVGADHGALGCSTVRDAVRHCFWCCGSCCGCVHVDSCKLSPCRPQVASGAIQILGACTCSQILHGAQGSRAGMDGSMAPSRTSPAVRAQVQAQAAWVAWPCRAICRAWFRT